ncbi:MAG: hypothetical protein ACK55Z_10900, partial [bacterium]
HRPHGAAPPHEGDRGVEESPGEVCPTISRRGVRGVRARQGRMGPEEHGVLNGSQQPQLERREPEGLQEL